MTKMTKKSEASEKLAEVIEGAVQRASITETTKDPEKMCSFVNKENGVRCERIKKAHGLCWAHYQQTQRGQPLTPITAQGTLRMIQGNIRVDPETHKLVLQRVASGKAKSVYAAVRQAVEEGTQAWARNVELPELLNPVQLPKIQPTWTQCRFEHEGEQCEGRAVGHGLCMSHYRQFQRHGELKPINRQVGRDVIAGNIRFNEETYQILEDRQKETGASSMDRVLHEALNVGVSLWRANRSVIGDINKQMLLEAKLKTVESKQKKGKKKTVAK